MSFLRRLGDVAGGVADGAGTGVYLGLSLRDAQARHQSRQASLQAAMDDNLRANAEAAREAADHQYLMGRREALGGFSDNLRAGGNDMMADLANVGEPDQAFDFFGRFGPPTTGQRFDLSGDVVGSGLYKEHEVGPLLSMLGRAATSLKYGTPTSPISVSRTSGFLDSMDERIGGGVPMKGRPAGAMEAAAPERATVTGPALPVTQGGVPTGPHAAETGALIDRAMHAQEMRTSKQAMDNLLELAAGDTSAAHALMSAFAREGVDPDELPALIEFMQGSQVGAPENPSGVPPSLMLGGTHALGPPQPGQLMEGRVPGMDAAVGPPQAGRVMEGRTGGHGVELTPSERTAVDVLGAALRTNQAGFLQELQGRYGPQLMEGRGPGIPQAILDMPGGDIPPDTRPMVGGRPTTGGNAMDAAAGDTTGVMHPHLPADQQWLYSEEERAAMDAAAGDMTRGDSIRAGLGPYRGQPGWFPGDPVKRKLTPYAQRHR